MRKYTVNEIMTLSMMNKAEIKHPVFSYSELSIEEAGKIGDMGFEQLKESKGYVNDEFTDEVMETAYYLKEYAKNPNQFTYAGLLYSFDKEKNQGILIIFEDFNKIYVKSTVGEMVLAEILRDEYAKGYDEVPEPSDWIKTSEDFTTGIKLNQHARNIEYQEKGEVKYISTIMPDGKFLVEVDPTEHKVRKVDSYYLVSKIADLLGGVTHE